MMNLVDLVQTGKRSRWVALWNPRIFFGVAMPLVMAANFAVGFISFDLQGRTLNVLMLIVPLLAGYFLHVWRRATLFFSCVLPFLIEEIGASYDDPDERSRRLGIFRDWLMANELVGPKVSPWIWDQASRACFALTCSYLDHFLEHAKSHPLQGPWEDVDDFLPIDERLRLLAIQTKLAIPALVYEEFGFFNALYFSAFVGIPMSLGRMCHDPMLMKHIADMLEILRWW